MFKLSLKGKEYEYWSSTFPLTINKEQSLVVALTLTGTFVLIEVAGGIITGSLALIPDAVHMLTDVTALIIALVSIKMSQRPADSIRTFGYYRFEILAATFNTILLLLVALFSNFIFA